MRSTRLTIKSRLSLRFGLVVALVTVGLGTYLYFEVRSEVLSAVDQGLRARVSEVQGTITSETNGVIDPGSKYFEHDQSFIQVFSGTSLVESSTNLADKPMLSDATLDSVARSEFFTTTLDGGLRVRILVSRHDQPGKDGFVVVGQNLNPVQHKLGTLFMEYFVACLLAVCLLLCIVWLSIRGALTPVERIRQQAGTISTGKGTGHLQVPDRNDEIARLSQTLNEMVDRIRSATERERRFVMFASHELRTPLTVLRTELELALSQPRSAGELRAAIVSAGEEADRLARLSDALIALAAIDGGPQSSEFEEHDLPSLVSDTCVSLVRPGVEVEVVTESAGGSTQASVSAACDPVQIRQAVTNMVENAARFSPPGEPIRVTVGLVGSLAYISVEDSGPGFPEEFLPFALDLFARSGQSDGAGLGLAIVSAVAHSHGGSASAANLPGGGAVVRIEFRGHAAAANPQGPVLKPRSTLISRDRAEVRR